MTLLLGLAGSVVGGGVAALLGTGDIWELNILGFVVAVIAAVALVGVAEGISNARTTPGVDPRSRRASTDGPPPDSPYTKEEIR